MKTILPFLIVLLTCFYATAQTNTADKQLGITLSFPEINSFTTPNVSKNGWLGFGAAIYYKKGKDKFSLNGAVTTAVTKQKMGENIDVISVDFVELLMHHQLYKNLQGIVGVNTSTYKFEHGNYWVVYGQADNGAYTINTQTIGATLGAEYAFTKTISLALFYRPALYSFQEKGNRQMISLDARFDINLFKIK